VIRILLHSNPATVSRSAVDRARSRSVGAETRALAAVPEASSLDFENTVCGRTSCSSDRGGHFWYRDSTHLSVDGALLLTHRFYLAINSRAKPSARA
jgi:SGNH domain-containing protein